MNRFFDRHKKTIIWIMVIGFFLGSVGLAAFQYMQPGGGSSSEDSGSGTSVALVVNGDEIKESEFQNTYDNLMQRQESLYSQLDRDFSSMLEGASGKLFELRIKSQAVDSLIEGALIDQKAEERGIQISDGEVNSRYDDQLDSLLEQQGWTLDQLKSALSSQGRTYDEFESTMKDDIRTQLSREKLRDQVIGEIDPTEEDLRNYYEENMDTYVQTPSRVRASHIVVDSEDRAKDIKNKIDENPDYFQEYVEENEVEADMGWLQKGEQPQAVEEVAFSLEPGEVGGPVRTSDGWQILKVEEKQERQVQDFEENKEKIREDYVDQEESQRYQDWYDEVKSEASIEIQLPVVEAYGTAQDDFQAGLEAYRELEESNEVRDQYIPYYIGRLYQEEIDRLKEESDSSSENGDREEKIGRYERKAVENYLEVIKETQSKDGDLLNRAKDLAPQNPEVNYYLARYQAENKKYSRAAESFKRAIESDKEYVAAYVDYGDMLVELENYEEAINQYRKGLELSDDNVNIMNKLAGAYSQAGQYDEAASIYERVLEESSDNFSAMKGLGDLYREQGESDMAIEYYNDALNVRSDTETSLSLARVYLKTGELEDAKMELDRVISTSPYNGEAYSLRGDYFLKEDRPERALEEYREGLARAQDAEIRIEISKKILDQEPEDKETRFTLARAYQEEHVYDSAIEQYREIIDRTEDQTELREAYSGLGQVYLSRTEYEKARETFQKGLELAETSVQRLDFYQNLLKADEEQNGEEDLSEVGKQALLEIAEIRIDQGDYSAAKERLNRLKELDSGFKEERVEELSGRIESSDQGQD
ncbi:MAG: tetratricopeptide repeat protein [Candidatus Bipolaricaulota bacterium]